MKCDLKKMCDVLQISSLFEKAISPEEENHIEFANSIHLLLETFPPKWISDRLIPFLTTWLPRNNKRILPIISSKLPLIIKSAETILSCFPLTEAILSVGDPVIFDRIALSIEKLPPDDTFPQFLQKIATSPYDSVRSFAPRLINKIENQKEIMTNLIYDKAFIVRQASALSLPKLASELAAQVALSLSSDQSSRIRSIIPHLVYKRRFFLSIIVPKLVHDYDWCVRASLAKNLALARSPDEAIEFCQILVEDNVWQVKLCALRSIGELVPKLKNQESFSIDSMMSILQKSIRLPQLSLKSTVLNTFIEVQRVQKSDCQLLVNEIIENQPDEIRLSFIELVIAEQRNDLLEKMQSDIFHLLEKLTKSDKWRIRKGATDLFYKIHKMLNDNELKQILADKSLSLLDDSARPVRESAIEQLSYFSLDNDKNDIPEFYYTLKSSDNFRKRQCAIKTLAILYKNLECKEKVKTEMQSFLEDPCINVSLLAKEQMLSQ